MAQGRGSAAGCNAAVLALVLLCVLLHGELAESAVYTVGDPRRLELQHRRLAPGQALPRRRRARVQVQPVGAQRGGGERGGVQVVQRAEGRQGVQVGERPRHAGARHQLLHLQLPRPLPGRHEDRRHRRVIGRPAIQLLVLVVPPVAGVRRGRI